MVIIVLGDDSGNDSENDAKACPMEMTFHTSFNTCYGSSTIATATIYADGLCHIVETNLSPSDENYSILPGNYRAECTSDGKLNFLVSACEEGTCSQDATCSSNDALEGSLFARVQGQLVQDSSVGDSYTCETLYDDQYEIFFVIFGDCSLPGCSVDGSVNPNPSEPSNSPISEPQPQPTRRPISPTNAPQATTTPVPITIPSTEQPQTLAPIENAPPTLSPISSSPVAMPIVSAPVTVTLQPTASPIIASVPTVSPTRFPTKSPVIMPIETVTPTASPVDESDPTTSPIKNVRSPSPVKQPNPNPTPPSSVTQSSSSNNNNVVVLGAIGGSITVIVMVVILFFVQKQCRQCKSVDSKNGAVTTTASSKETKELQLAHDLQNHDRLLATTATNEIWFDPSRDDVSTLDGGTIPDMALGAAGDEPTASVNMDFDYNKNRYRSSATVDEHSRFTSSTNPTAFTTLSKLGMRSATSSLFDRNNDDQSFDQQFADMDDEEIMTAVGSMNWSRTRSNDKDANAALMNDIANRVRPFEVMAPPGMLGLVIDSPNGSVPVIRAIKPSSVLYPQVQVGDRLISVDHQNVTNMTATQVSHLITQKQNQNRVFVFCRLMSESQQNS